MEDDLTLLHTIEIQIYNLKTGTPVKNEKPTTSTPQNNQQRRGQKRKLKEDEPFVVHENGKLDHNCNSIQLHFCLI